MTVDAETLIVGSGFAGTSVASQLPSDSFMLIDRGEPIDYLGAARRVEWSNLPQDRDTVTLREEAELAALSRGDPAKVSLPFSGMTVNIYAYIMGGISNLWGGYASRISRETFSREGVVSWPIDLEELAPFYVEAERLLSVHGDPEWPDYSVIGEIPGWRQWRDILRPWFPKAHVTPQAKNLSGYHAEPFGICLGNGNCHLCPNDAKARPTNVFPLLSAIGGAKVDQIQFEGNRAVSVSVTTSEGDVFVRFNKLVLATGGLENVAILKRSRLPREVPSSRVGRRYQDHTAAEVLVEMPFEVPRLSLGAESHMELPELSGYFEGIEIKSIFLIWYPESQFMAASIKDPLLDDATLIERSKRMASIYLQIEIPPEWNLSVVSRGNNVYLDTFPYLRHVAVIDRAVKQICDRIRELGLHIGVVVPHYRRAFGGHHYSGATPMSRNEGAVVDSNQKLIGTDNVYLNGASVLPRCGNSGPTLSLVALGLRLGRYLG